MKFVIYSLNYSPELTGIGKYNGELARDLVKRGHKVDVVTAPPYYPEWQVHKGYKNTWSVENDEGVTVHRNPIYVTKNLTTLKRLLHLVSFALSSIVSLFKLIKLKPDAVFCVQPTLFCAPMTLLFCKLTGAKSIMHVQDFEVDAMFGLNMSAGKVEKLGRAFEKWCLKRFDVVSSISHSMLDNAKKKGVPQEKLLFFPNWSNTEFVTPEIDGSEFRAKWGYSAEDKLVLYSGNIGQKQGLEMLLDAAKHYEAQPHVKFIIIGNGSYKEELQAMAQNMNLTNLVFKPLQEWEDVPKVLSMADVHLVIQKKGAADAVLPSKLTNILSAGGFSIVTAEEHTELGNIVDKHPGIYECVEPESLEAFIAGLDRLLAQDMSTHNVVARRYAEKFLNTAMVIQQFEKDCEAIIADTSNLYASRDDV
ncbi:MAG: glycosyltransferase WbuB [Pseudomonadota bacterium]|nr:glycosyltransferase WbuB [Pseudomonadota bacterium]